MNMQEAVWRTSSRSGSQGNCVEVATNLPGVVAVRDSKHREGPALIFTQDDWKDFLTQLHSSPAQG